jgi:hypothetical protein
MDFISNNLVLSNDDDAQNWSNTDDDEPMPSPVISRQGSVSSTFSRASELLVEDNANDNNNAIVDSTDDRSMILPPEGCFLSFDALEQSANLHAQEYRYAVSGIWSKAQYKTKSTCRKIYIGCQCSTKYRDCTKRACCQEQHILKTNC